MKNIDEILFVVQARCNSERVPNKMLRDIDNTNLFKICLEKIKKSNIPLDNFIASVHEPELCTVADDLKLNIFHRSRQSANEEKDIKIMYEWHDKFPQFKYVVLINACNLFLTVDTINRFIEQYINTDNDGLFGVTPRKQYYWNSNGDLITKWPEGFNLMNTKYVSETYEAAHCIYAGNLSLISENLWMGMPPYSKDNPELFFVSDFESLDIDYEWQFGLYTHYWKLLNDKSNC